MQEKGHCQVAYLLFRVLFRRYEIDGFQVAEIDIPAKYIYVQKLYSVSTRAQNNKKILPCRRISFCDIHLNCHLCSL